jgi:hypothetical protein
MDDTRFSKIFKNILNEQSVASDLKGATESPVNLTPTEGPEGEESNLKKDLDKTNKLTDVMSQDRNKSIVKVKAIANEINTFSSKMREGKWSEIIKSSYPNDKDAGDVITKMLNTTTDLADILAKLEILIQVPQEEAKI